MSVQASQILSSQKSQDLNQIKVFKNILNEVGVKLSLGDEQHILTQEQALVARDLEKLMENSTDRTEEFVNGLKTLCKKQKYFRKALLLTILRKNDTLSCRNEKIEQESLLRILLKVTRLQDSVIEIILSEIINISSDTSEDTSWLHMLLNPLRYLPYIKNPESITKQLLDVLEIATYPAQLEILDSIPEIIPDCQYSETAEQLCDILDDKDELTGAIIDCLNALDLDAEMRTKVQDTILSKILSGTSLKVFPVLLSFLMTDCKSQNLGQTLFKIRNALDTLMLTSDKNKDKESCKILIFSKLQTYAISSKTVSEAWLNMISMIKSHSDHKPVDYLILFMLHGTVPLKKRIIEAVFRKRIHMGLFKISHLEKMFEKYLPQQLLKDYFNSIVEIGCSLVRSSNDQIITEWASTFFKLLFFHDHTESIYRREILDNLVILSGATDKKTVGTVLKIISSFIAEKPKLQQHTVLLMRLLEKIDSFELKDVKMVFEILCSLTCGEDADSSMSGLRDEIHMIVRKQLFSTKRVVKHRGIISAVVMARHMVLTAEEQPNCPHEAITSVSKLPLGLAREAGTLLELTSTCTVNSAELQGLYYDQLTAMLMSKNHLDKYFMAWLYVTITKGFEQTFATNKIPDKINDIGMSMQYMLNDATESDNLGINIAGLVLKKDPQILLLAPHFRLLRLLHYRQHDSQLDGINALLGCGIIMPNVDLDDLELDQARPVADCLFYCINWFREVVSGFVTQPTRHLRSKVIRRLEDLLQTEQKLRQCMNNIPEHKLPVSYFDSITEHIKQNTTQESKTKNPKKKAKTATAANDADDTANTTAGPSHSKKKKSITKTTSQNEHPIQFREMDTDLILLIKYPLKLGDELGTQTATLTMEQLKFILKDFAGKLANLTQNKDVGVLHLNMVAPINLISDGVVVLPNLDAHLTVIVNKIKDLLEKTDGRLDLPEMFTDEVLDIKTCFGLILEIFHLIFSWAGFQHSSNLEILKSLLEGIRKGKSSQILNSAHHMIAEFIQRISEIWEQCLELSHAVSLIKIMESLYSASTPNPEIQKKIATVARHLLSKRWYNSKGNLECGKNCNLNIETLVKIYLSSANVKTISGLVGTLQDQVNSLKNKEDCLHMLASIDKQNFHVFYNGLSNTLLNRVKTEVQSLTTSQHLVLWHTVASTLQGLMEVAKVQETKTNLVCFIKKAIGILKLFLSDGIPILEITLKSKPDDVLEIFKLVQSNTRFLHHLCCYSKLTKDSSLMPFVPKFRLVLETLVYRVKAALAANNCSAAFWMGNLRNKDLRGEDILSQSTVTTEQNDHNNSDEELPDDDSDDELTNNDSDDARSRSSEVYE